MSCTRVQGPDTATGERAGAMSASAKGCSTLFCRVAVTTDPASVLEPWRELAAIAAVSPYQTPAFLLPWIATEGVAADITPTLVSVFDRQERLVALLPLGLVRQGPLRIATFLGGRHSNYNMALFRPGLIWRRDDVYELLRAVRRALPGRVDLFAFVNQPLGWDGVPNPFATLPGQPSPSFSHRVDLPPDAERFFAACHSAHARKVLRSKRKRLEAMGPLSHRRGTNPAEIEAILQAYLAQKSAKLDVIGVASEIESRSLRDFLGRLMADPAAGAGPELHGLYCGERIVATFGGLRHGTHVSGLFISYDGDPEIARCSPGEILLGDIVRQKCQEGLTSFDLGIGEARYKQTYCPVDDPLFDSFVPMTLAGRLFVSVAAQRLRLKGWIKRNPWAWSMVGRMRLLKRRLTKLGSTTT